MKLIAVLLLLGFNLLGLGVSLAKHGRPREGRENFWVTLFTGVLVIVLYYLAGLFDGIFA